MAINLKFLPALIGAVALATTLGSPRTSRPAAAPRPAPEPAATVRPAGSGGGSSVALVARREPGPAKDELLGKAYRDDR